MSATAVPLSVRIELCRASVQVMADRLGIRLLHIKGATVDRTIRAQVSGGTDVDVICEPVRIAEMHARLTGHGWQVYSTFDDGSPFAHAQTYWHPDWGYLDLHRRFPGIGLHDDEAFELLWRDRGEHRCAGRLAWVPSVDAQALLLMLNAARKTPGHRGSAGAFWEQQSEDDRRRRVALAELLRAEVALAVSTGDLEDFRDRREYSLWKAVSERGSRTQEWWARVRAAPSVREALVVVARAPLVNRSRLAHELGREPRARDIAVAFLRRARAAFREAVAGRRSRP